jgi:hypothetical protein
VSRLQRRWPRRRTDSPAVNAGHEPPSRLDQHVEAEGSAYIAGRDQSTHNVVNMNISLVVAQLLRDRPDGTPYVYEVASQSGVPAEGNASVEEVLRRLADLNVPAEAFPPILKVSELIRQHADDQETREVFGLVADHWAAQDPARRESLEDLRQASGELPDAPPADPCLLIVLDPDYYSTDHYRLSVVLYRHGRNGDRQDDDSDAMPVATIEERLKQSLPRLFTKSRGQPFIEFAVPPELLGTPFDQWSVPSRPDGPPEEDYQLGEIGPLVLRDIDRILPGADRSAWEQRWRRLCASHGDGSSLEVLRLVFPEKNETYKQLRASLRHTDARGKAFLALLAGPTAAFRRMEQLKAGLAAGIPAAIWLREPDEGAPEQEADREYLQRVIGSTELPSLPRKVMDLRLEAVVDGEPAGHPGTRLSLLWDDPGRTWERSFTAPESSSNGDDF